MTAFNKDRPKPKWLSKEHANENTRRGQRYYNHLWDAQPPWPGITKAIRSIYREARRMRRMGLDVEVDHIVPLNHPQICGLHVPANLRITSKDVNARKSNRVYPGMADEQLDLFAKTHAPDDFMLEIQDGAQER